MKILIVEDDFVTRRILKDMLSEFGECDIAINGEEAVQAFRMSIADGFKYDLICMDIMMPEIDGHEAVRLIREIEEKLVVPIEDEVCIIMISALNDPKNVFKAYNEGSTAYIAKPIEKAILIEELKKLNLISEKYQSTKENDED